ncbi:MAG: potassium transporter Kup [Alphaproteobacteria bacterium]
MTERTSSHPQGLGALAIGALGVVYGDIGTSPLYTMRVAFGELSGLRPIEANVLGVLSLIFWSLFIVVTVKYLVLVLRADNRGEGGIMALMALSRRALRSRPRLLAALFPLGVLGTGLFCGESVITPAISVLSAVEGLHEATPLFDPYVVPLTLVVLIALFAIQSRGAGAVGRLFGPIMGVWFTTIAVLGIVEILDQPQVLAAIDPRHAFDFAAAHGWHTIITLGAVMLAFTGAEALYADMGHFGRTPIRVAWFGLVMPSLLLNYFGQGALLLSDPAAVRNPFFLLGPPAVLYPMVALATVATVIASQAVISGAFSIYSQSVQLGYAPRARIDYTSEHRMGQIYLSRINWALLVAVVALVLGFGSSDRLGAAYGLSVTGTMVASTVLAGSVAFGKWRWRPVAVFAVFGCLLVVDLIFLTSNIIKIPEGGWVPLLLGLAVFFLMTTWRRGRAELNKRLRDESMGLDTFLETLRAETMQRVPGTAVYMARIGDAVPHALLHNLKHNRVLHERVVLLTVVNEDIPRVADDDRVDVTVLPKRFYRVTVHYGFTEPPDLPQALARCASRGLDFDMMETSFFLGRVTLVPAERSSLSTLRRHVFFLLTRNALSATDFYRIPTNRVVELGAQIAL